MIFNVWKRGKFFQLEKYEFSFWKRGKCDTVVVFDDFERWEGTKVRHRRRFWRILKTRGISVLCDQPMRSDFREFYLSTLVSVFLSHLAIADKRAGLAPSLLAGVVGVLSHRCCLEKPAS